MKTKILILFLTLAIVFGMTGCFELPENKIVVGDFVYYDDYYNGYTFYTVADHAIDKEVFYIPDEVEGQTLKVLGLRNIAHGGGFMTFGQCTNLKKVYFPWSIEEIAGSVNWPAPKFTERKTYYVISASTKRFIDATISGNIYVLPYTYYKRLQFSHLGDDSLAANISFMFNYENNPNEGYFFVDLVEESGLITKPPYDPKRDGYTFAGWYKDPECLTPWNFDTDVITIEFDEEGNRIYEEICLYAKWIEE